MCAWNLDNFVNQPHPISSVKRKRADASILTDGWCARSSLVCLSVCSQAKGWAGQEPAAWRQEPCGATGWPGPQGPSRAGLARCPPRGSSDLAGLHGTAVPGDPQWRLVSRPSPRGRRPAAWRGASLVRDAGLSRPVVAPGLQQVSLRAQLRPGQAAPTPPREMRRPLSAAEAWVGAALQPLTSV